MLIVRLSDDVPISVLLVGDVAEVMHKEAVEAWWKDGVAIAVIYQELLVHVYPLCQLLLELAERAAVDDLDVYVVHPEGFQRFSSRKLSRRSP